ncbi:hypothetical protein E2562_014905 [Oryza meyeriana var. granulata]|uniref:Uncharacterized protein n=1 Tax=Oryza meyeriana var. granulata TaxID=110450 RepID=A0A6G1EJ69_9ORYZ|nr:hypothetical protein E2562_014905 [Oryza meyeriana var. granulata]
MSVLGGTGEIERAALVVDLVANDVLLHGEAERVPATDLAVVGLEILYLDSLRIENINVQTKGSRATLRLIVEHGEIPLFGSGFDFRTIDANEETDDSGDKDYVEDIKSEDEDNDDDNNYDEVEDTDDGDKEGDEDADGSKDGDGDEGQDGLKHGDDDDNEDKVEGKGTTQDANAAKDRDGDEKLAESKKNKDGGEDVALEDN